jgi:hypothetical protein
MNYFIEFDNQEISLPQYSWDIEDKLVEADKINMSENKTSRQKGEHLYNLECELIGENKTKAIVGGDIKSCDPNAIQVVFIKILRAYDKPIEDVNAEKEQPMLDQLGQISEYADKVSKMPEVVDKVSGAK